MKTYGLIGRSLGHSWSQRYFNEKFKTEGISDTKYELYELGSINDLPELLRSNPEILGLNVTIPYKKEVLSMLDDIDPIAHEVGAVNTIAIDNGKLKGYNTDVFGFKSSLAPLLAGRSERAIVLGTGGAAGSVQFVLQELGIETITVSRKHGNGTKTYEDLTKDDILAHELIINCTPVGMWPNVEDYPPIPYEAISDQHILFDLIYNPEQTAFLKEGTMRGALTENGLDMLRLQAEESWRIWNSEGS